MAKIKREKVKKYNLELSEEEYFLILTLIGRTSYEEYEKMIIERHSILFGEKNENFKKIDKEPLVEFYNTLNDNK